MQALDSTGTITRYAYVTQHIDTVRKLVASKTIPGQVLKDLTAYIEYLKCTDDAGQMNRYEEAAERCGCSSRTIMTAVKRMEEFI